MIPSALVGREHELAVAEGTLDAVPSGGLVLAGPAGVGKTRLIAEILERARRRGRPTAVVTASRAAATIPFAAVAHLAPDVDTSDRLRILRGAEQWLASRGAPVVLGVDDAHDLDDGSATLVHRVATTGVASVVATLREGAPAPDPVTALWKEGHAARLEVGPLGRDEMDRLLVTLLGRPLDGVARERLWRLSQGNALYAHELVRGGLASGALVDHDGVWRWRGPIAPAPHLITLVDERVGEQPAGVRDAVDLVALGEPLPMSLLERAGVDPEVVDRAERAGLLRSEPADRDIDVALAHPIFGEVARARASPLRRRELSRRLAQAAKDSDDPVRRASWHLDGGPVGPHDADVLTAGAQRALAALDLGLARRLARAAVDGGGGTAAQRLLAVVLVLAGDGEQAEAVLAGLATNHPTTRDAGFRAWNLTFVLRQPDQAEQVLREAATSGVGGLEPLTLQRALVDAFGGRTARARDAATTVATAPGTDDETALRAWSLTAQCLSVQGRYVDSRAAVRHAVEIDRRLSGGDWSMVVEEFSSADACALLYAGHLDEAESVIERGRERAAAAGWSGGLAVWLSWRADLLTARGRVREAFERVRESAALAAGGAEPYRAWTERVRALQRARTAAMLGEVADAEAAASEAERWDDGTTGLADVWAGSGAAWLAAARGEPTAAVDAALLDAERACRAEQFAWEAIALHQAVRFGAPERAATRLGELVGVVDGPLIEVFARQAAAAASGDGVELDAVVASYTDLGYLLLAAEAGAQAGTAHRAAGLSAAAGASVTRARELAAQCTGARTPALALLTDRGDLTRRENEIARLAASGLTNRAIADELVISVRTVDNTLHQVYAKLGVAGRRDLRVLFDRGDDA